MSRNISAVLADSAIYDDCLLTSCLRKLFVRAAKDTVQPSFVVYNNVAACSDELAKLNSPDAIETSYAYLAGMEQSLPEAAFRYVVIYKKNLPVLFGYFQLYTLTSANFDLEKNKGFIKGIFQFFLGLKKINVLFSGNALRAETRWFCADARALTEEESIDILVAAAEKIARQECASALVIKDIKATPRARKWLAKGGFKVPLPDLAMVVQIDASWQGLKGYIAALSRKYKTRANKVLAAASGLQVRQLTDNEVTAREPEIYRLFTNVADNQPFVLTRPAENHFSMLKGVYGNSFEVTGFFDGGKLIAFYSSFITEDAYEVYYIGLDYQLNAEYQLYFNVLFSSMERAIALHKKALKLGRTSFDAKASMGAKPIEMDYFIKLAKAPNMVVNWFVNYFSSMEDGRWKLRNPLG